MVKVMKNEFTVIPKPLKPFLSASQSLGDGHEVEHSLDSTLYNIISYTNDKNDGLQYTSTR